VIAEFADLGRRVSSGRRQDVPMEPVGRIVVRRRRGGYRDRLRSYWIEIDGRRAGKVAQGEDAEFPVPPGEHTVRAVIDWAGSPAVRVDVDAGRPGRLLVEPAGNAFQFWQAFQRDRYLRLTAE
jgi:hypothetical protein